MDSWFVLGLLAAVSYALSGLAAKIALSKNYVGLSVPSAALLTMVGVVIVFTSFYLITSKLAFPKLTLSSAVVGIAVGFFWALGAVIVYHALTKGADISRMAPIYNLNTLIVVVLAVVLLRELPDKSSLFRVFLGAVLIVAGGILVSI